MVTHHYVGYELTWQLGVNVLVLIFNIVPKLPEMHGVRICRRLRHYDD